MRHYQKIKPRYLFIFIALIALLFAAYLNKPPRINHYIESDTEGYYLYLKALLVADGFENQPFKNGATIRVNPDGDTVSFTKYTYGVALLEAPFVIAAHYVAPVLGYAKNGISKPYAWGIIIASVFYLVLGLRFIYLWLKSRFKPNVLMATIVLIFFATNLFYYSTRGGGMSHVYSFFLFSVFIYSVHRFTLGSRKWIIPGSFSLALAIIIRPTNAIIVLAPLLMDTATLKDIKLKFRFWINNWKYLLWIIPVFIALISPQLAYWKYTTGNYIWYSYEDEGFSNWADPQMFKVLFSYQNGLFLYTPIMIFITWGMLIMWRKNKKGKFLNPTVLLIATYIFGSWWAWWFGGAFGHRCYVEYFSFMSLPLAVFLEKIRTLNQAKRRLLYTLMGLFVFINIRMTDIYNGRWDGPDWHLSDYLDLILQVFYIDRFI